MVWTAKLFRSLMLANCAAPAGKTRTGLWSLPGEPPDQLLSSDQLLLMPAPLQVWVAGGSRFSKASSNSRRHNLWRGFDKDFCLRRLELRLNQPLPPGHALSATPSTERCPHSHTLAH